MTRKSPIGFAENRCSRCRVLKRMCICDLIPRIATQTRVVLVVHYCETFKSSNTARLIEMALDNCDLRVRGAPEGRRDHGDVAGDRSFILFPSEDAEELTPEHAAQGPITLIVPDGSWRQAKKTARREKGIEHLPRVKLPPGPPSQYQLRSSPRADGVCTLEAVARALGVVESKKVQAQLEAVLDLMVNRNLWARGKGHGSSAQFESGFPLL